ncbi:MAG: right-handed parallel beta-helix repeat-containing protein, partial [Candidatus Bathyarchaeota archaeon]
MRRTASSLASLLLFLGALSILSNIHSVGASGTIYIRFDGSIEPATPNILTFDNTTYVLTNDIYEGIVIQRSNITLDGKGHMLKGSEIGAGLLLSGGSSVTIKNMTISDFLWGIFIESPRNNISGNNIAGSMYGIIINSAYNTISNNAISGSETGKAIHCYWGSATTIIDNVIENGIYLRGNRHKISGNRITRSGIICDASSGNIIQRNLIFACPYAGITLSSMHAYNNLIVENEIIHCTSGVNLVEAENTTFWHNNLINNTHQVSGHRYTAIWD